MKNIFIPILLAASTFVSGASFAGETPSPDGAKVYFINLKDGMEVTNPVNIKFGLSGMGVSPAGVEALENTGHHHLIIDEQIEGEELDYGIPDDEKHIHFGKGQTEATLDLPKGTHILQLVLGDWSHVPHDKPVMSKRIKITVK